MRIFKRMPLQDNNLGRIAAILKALAHPLRLGIVYLLSEHDAMRVTEIYKRLNIGQAEASRQLGVLRRSGLLNAERSGKNIWYSLKNRKVLDVLKSAEGCA